MGIERKRIVVTGANGFVGQSVLRALARSGAQAVACVRAGRQVEHAGIEVRSVGDWTDVEISAALEGADAVVHAASVVHRPGASLDEYERFNVLGTRVLVDACRRNRVPRLVFLSSIKVYGETPPGTVDEWTPVDPKSSYARSKLEAERTILDAAASRGPSGLVLRLCPVFGRGDKGNVRTVARAIARRRFVVPGNGSTRKSLVHVSTVADAVLRAVDSEVSGTFVIADRVAPSIRELADELAAALGRPPPPAVPVPIVMTAATALEALSRLRGRPPSVSRDLIRKSLSSSVCSPARFERTFKVICRVDLRDAIRDEVGWLRDQRLL